MANSLESSPDAPLVGAFAPIEAAEPVGPAGPSAPVEAPPLAQGPAPVAPVAPRQRRWGAPRRKRLRLLRRLRSLLAYLAPALFVLGFDFLQRAIQLVSLKPTPRWAYRGTFAVSFVFWTVLLFAASRRRGWFRFLAAPVFIVLFTLSLGVQGGFRAIFNNYLTIDAEVFSRSLGWSVLGTLPLGRAVVWFYFGVMLAAAIAMLRNARKRRARHGRIVRFVTPLLTLAVLAGLFFVPTSYRDVQASTPDMLYFHTVVGVYKEQHGITANATRWRPQHRSSLPVPSLAARPARPRNVILILQESQRADVTCTEYTPDCQLATRASNQAVPGRLPLLQLRANDSSTSNSCSTIWTGLSPADTEKNLRTAPTLWSYASAAGYDTAYFTSQQIIYHNMRTQMQDEAINHFACATTLDPVADLDTGANDMKLSEHVIQQWSQLKEPFFAVVQYSNQHMPYVIDRKKSPFPYDSASKKDSAKNKLAYYKNVVYLSDLAVGRLLDSIRASEKGKRTVIVYTADHGEGNNEHGIVGHTFSQFDNEIRVPGWVDAPPGTLAPEEEASLREVKDGIVFHHDLAPTFLDLLGVWDDPKLAPFKEHMPGHPLTRHERTSGPVVLTNCTWIWESQTANWGAMNGSLKAMIRPEWPNYRCYDVLADPLETKDLGEPACGNLADVARKMFPPPKSNHPLHPLR